MTVRTAPGVAPVALPADNEKRVWAGTHRVCSPEETMRRIEPLFPTVGITRLADVTRLDDIGIPVYQAVRPNSRNLAVSQGKGVTPLLAKVSGAMEAIELWHAERVSVSLPRTTVGEVAGRLPYSVSDLPVRPFNCLNERLLLDWATATDLVSGESTLVPQSVVELDFTLPPVWPPVPFRVSSNGLASGNTFAEATLHGLFEVIERDSITRWESRALEGCSTQVDPDTITDGIAAELLEFLAAAGADVSVFDLTGPTGVPAFAANIWSEAFPVVFSGFGCHLDKDVSLCRAVTEAAQSRLTFISGARDDLEEDAYDWTSSRTRKPEWEATGGRDYRDVASSASDDIDLDLKRVVGLTLELTGLSPLVVDLTRSSVDIPVARVIAPGLSHWSHAR